MAKTKISEFGSTPANNTDIDSINIAEGCAPSNINDAIRELMAQLKDFQIGSQGDSFNGPIGTSTAAAGAFTTLTASSTLGVTGVSTLTGGAVVQGLTVGRGAGAVSTNTAVGASALSGSNTGGYNTAVGLSTLAANTSGAFQTALGWSALLANTTGTANTALGAATLYANTTGSNNLAVGSASSGNSPLQANTTGSFNTALGNNALASNTTASNNTAVGYQALYTNTTATWNTALGYQAAYTSNNTGVTAVGYQALKVSVADYNTAIGLNAGVATTTGTVDAFGAGALGANTTGAANSAFSRDALSANTTGSNNVAVGRSALQSNTTANNNTAVGYQAGYSNTTNGANTFFGSGAGYTSTGSYNSCFGYQAGYGITTGTNNTFVGTYVSGLGGVGSLITTGSKNTIIGGYNGNQGGLDIRTASNYIVLSDGDGNPYAQCNASFWKFGIGGTGSAYGGGSVSLNGSTASGYQPSIGGYGNGTAYWTIGTKGAIDGSSSTFLQCQNTGGGVYLNGASATSWTAVSDERLKENLVDITDAATKVSTLRAVVGNYTWDEEKSRKPFLIAQDVQAVLPEAVSASRQFKDDETEYLGVSYTEVIPLLVAAIKELKAEIDILKGNV